MTFKPLLSGTIDPMKDPDVFTKLVFPLLGSPKLDGIRAIVRDQFVMSRTLKPLPRRHVQVAFDHLAHLDGELIVGSPSAPDCYNRTQSYIMSNDDRDPEQVTYYVFDWAKEEDAHLPYWDRIGKAQDSLLFDKVPNIVFVEQRLINNLDEMLAFEAECLSAGYEGIMLRRADAPYKHGRSTFKEHTLLKLKRFEDVEATITGFIEQETNTNEAVKDELGHTKRSSAKEGMVGADTLGKFVTDLGEIPCGVLKHHQRKAIWDDQNAYLGKIIKVRHFPHGAKDMLRLPRCVGFRDPIDL